MLGRLAKLIGQDPLAIEKLWADLFLEVSYSGWAGAEMRAISAIDIALWDLAGQACGRPVYQLMGGPCRQSIPVSLQHLLRSPGFPHAACGGTG